MKIVATDALIVVDVQRDFCPGGALAVNEGDAVVPIINRIAPRFATKVYTRDWHPADHCSFSATPQYVDGSWPAHCLQDSEGAAFHPALEAPDDALVVNKGNDPAREAYSAFQDTDLAERLRARSIERVFVCGLATDYCVKSTALDAQGEGFEVVIVEDACRGVDVPPGSAAKALNELVESGVVRIRSDGIR